MEMLSAMIVQVCTGNKESTWSTRNTLQNSAVIEIVLMMLNEMGVNLLRAMMLNKLNDSVLWAVLCDTIAMIFLCCAVTNDGASTFPCNLYLQSS
jgi:hypothetical protein